MLEHGKNVTAQRNLFFELVQPCLLPIHCLYYYSKQEGGHIQCKSPRKKNRQSHLLHFPALKYCIYNAFDSALSGAVKTNAILTALVCVCVCVSWLLPEIHRLRTASQTFRHIFTVWNMRFLCAFLCAHTVFIC